MHHGTGQAEDWGHEDCHICDEARQDKAFLKGFLAMQQRAHETAQRKGWHDEPREIGTVIALMHSELSEALEAARCNANSDKITGFTGIEEELADVIIRIMDASGQHGWRVARALVAKMAYNQIRPHRHGGKKF